MEQNQKNYTLEDLEVEVRHRDLMIDDLTQTVAKDTQTIAHLRAMIQTKDSENQQLLQQLQEREQKTEQKKK